MRARGQLGILTTASVALSLLLVGCGNNRNTFAAVGGAACSAIGAGVGGRHTSTGTRILRGVLGGGACAAIGGAIGQMLDDRDQERAAQARYAALSRTLPPSYYRTAAYNYAPRNAPQPPQQHPAPSSSDSGFHLPAFLGGSGGKQADPSPVAVSPPPTSTRSGRLPNVPRSADEQWVSDHSGASGSVTVIGIEPASDGQGECRTLRETAKTSTRSTPVSQDTTLCESSTGANDWKEI